MSTEAYEDLAEQLGDRATVSAWLEELRPLGVLDGARTLDELVQAHYDEDGCAACEEGPGDAFCAFCWSFSTHVVLNRLAALDHLIEFRDGAFRLRDQPGFPCGCRAARLTGGAR